MTVDERQAWPDTLSPEGLPDTRISTPVTSCPPPFRGNGGATRRISAPGIPPDPSSAPTGTFAPEGRRAVRLAIGLGFRKAATAAALADLVAEARTRLPAGLAGAPAVLATIAEKDRPALRDAAAALGFPVLVLPKSALAGTEDRITVASAAARACLGIPSVAEAAALAAAGPGARLVVARIASASATCAIACLEEP